MEMEIMLVFYSGILFQKVDFRKIGAEALIQEETTALPNKEKLVHHSAAFKVVKRDISEGSEDEVDDTTIIPTEKGETSNNPHLFLSSGITTSLFHPSQQNRCCLVLPGYIAKHKFGIHKILKEETANCISFLQVTVQSHIYPTQN